MGDAPEEARNTIEALKKVSDEIKKLRKPTGEKTSPARTCRELAASSEEKLKNGLYWVDPNGGGIADAIQVFCRFNNENLDDTQTCLVPATSVFEKKQWFTRRPSGAEEFALFAENFAESEFSYQTHKSQVKFLQYLNKKAKQRITIHCKNVVAVFDQANNTWDNAMKLISFDEEDVTAQGKKTFRYKVIEDNCKEKNGQWGTTVIEVRGKDQQLKRLPILDVGLKDVAGSEQEFGIEIGNACFGS